jgi:hypothetical protein
MTGLSWEDTKYMHNRHQEHHEHSEPSEHNVHITIHQHTIEEILMKINELLTVNQSIKGQLNKAEAEIVAKITELQDAVAALTEASANVDLPQDVVDSIAEVQTAAQALDDINADPTPAPVDPAV